jgi:hypothetical protein
MKRMIVSILFLSLVAATVYARPNQAGNGPSYGAARAAQTQGQAGNGDPQAGTLSKARSRQRIHDPAAGGDPAKAQDRRGQRLGGKGNADEPGSGNRKGQGPRGGKPDDG